jgi:hypothetical protein
MSEQTKNEAKARDPEMKQGKKNGREWRFGMKAHWVPISTGWYTLW